MLSAAKHLAANCDRPFASLRVTLCDCANCQAPFFTIEPCLIGQKTVKHTPADKLYDAWISLLTGAHGLVEINTRLRTDPGLQRAFGRSACAEQSVVQETLDACTTENVLQLQQALDEIFRQHSQSVQHDYQASFQLLDVDMSGLPCGPKAAFATRGYFAGQYHRRGRQVGRVLATGCPTSLPEV